MLRLLRAFSRTPSSKAEFQILPAQVDSLQELHRTRQQSDESDMSRKRKKSKRKKTTKPRKVTRGSGKKKTARANLPTGFSTPVITHFTFENPLFSLTDAQCREAFGKIGREAAKQFTDNFALLETLVREHDPLVLLATASFYCLFKGADPTTDVTADGPYPQPVVEVIQSVCLRCPRDTFRNTPVLHPLLFRTLDLARACLMDFGRQRYSSYEHVSEADKNLLLLIEGARLHTQFMRNWAYPQHMRLLIRELFEPLEHDIANVIGAGPLAILRLFDDLRDNSCARVSGFIRELGAAFRPQSLVKMVHAFCTLANVDDKEESAILQIIRSRPASKRQTQLFLLSFFHQYLAAFFTFTLDDCLKLALENLDKVRLGLLLDRLSLRFGDMAHDDPQHLMMQSRIRTRPFIKMDDNTYFLPIAGLANSFFVEIVETLIISQPDLKGRYHKRRAVFLEEKLRRLLDESFPGCPVHSGTTGISPIDGKEFENDCVVVAGPLAIVFEAKSERVDDVAKRGGAKTLGGHYETLVEAPAFQAERFGRILEQGKGIQTFRTKKHGTYQLDLSQIRRAICVSVTLDWFPAPTLCWRQLVKSNMVGAERRPAINLTLADLVVVMEVLTQPTIRLHYLWRRIEWEEHVDYLADEEDLLVYYLSEGLVIPNELRDGAPMHLYGNSNQLHRYYLAAWGDTATPIPRPRRILTDWWLAMLARIEANDIARKWDISSVLLDLNITQQQEFEKKFKRVVEKVGKGRNDLGENAVILFGRTTESKGAVVGFAYRDLSVDERNDRAADLAGQAQREHGAERVVVIGRDAVQQHHPYDFVAFSERGRHE